jgi:hypothetical protein
MKATIASFVQGLAAIAMTVITTSTGYADKTVDENGFIRLKAGQEEWAYYPNSNWQFMVIAGDPKKPGPYVLRYKVPARELSAPHFHPEDRFITVIQGTWWTGTGENFDPDNMIPLSPGSFMKHPAGGAHFDGSKGGEVIVQVVANGPSGLTFVHPEMGMSIKYEGK